MPHEAKKYIYDMREACRRIQEFTLEKRSEQFLQDPLLQSAVERQFQVLGEALQQLHKNHPEIAEQLPEFRNIINFRHILVHGYDRIEPEVVWGIVQSRVDGLLKELEKLLM